MHAEFPFPHLDYFFFFLEVMSTQVLVDLVLEKLPSWKRDVIFIIALDYNSSCSYNLCCLLLPLK